MRKILFDLFGVFMNVQSPEGKAELEKFVDLEGQGVATEDFWEAYERLRDQLDSGKWGYEEYLEMLGTELGLQFPDIDGFIRADYKSWSVPNDEMADFLRALVADEHEVGVLSNVPSALLAYLGADQAWLTIFQPRIFSGVVGMKKPEPEIFQLALAIMESHPADVLFVDDTQANVDAARALGFNAHLFTDTETAKKRVCSFLAGGGILADEQPTNE